MKKYYYLFIAITICNLTKGQTYSNPYPTPTKVEVTVKKNPYDYSSQYNQGVQTGTAIRQARAQESANFNEALKNNYSTISIDNLINNTTKYKYIFIEEVSGWKSNENKKDIIKILKGANKFQIIDETEFPKDSINISKVLYLNWLREAQGDDNRITQLSIKNFNKEIIYESTSKNLSHQEILKPLISNYVFTKETALEKVKEMKELLDLGVITKEEYDLKVLELKPILLGNN